jgi:PIN domain nuclease of toxin-antitoxin system
VRLLLDTHALLWFLLDDAKLSGNARSLITDPANDPLVSPASCWEIAIKISLGKYALEQDFAEFMEGQIAANDLTILPITVKHTAAVATLPFHHRDPFDRLLIAQAIVEGVPVLSNDPVFDLYPVERMW